MRGQVFISFLAIIILILSVSFVSASWYSDVWNSLNENSITGNVVGNSLCGTSGICKNIVYTNFAGGFQTLDVYLPVAGSKSPSPVILFIHPGSFAAGSKEDCWDSANNQPQWFIQNYRNNGFAVVCINYVLTDGGKHPFPEQVWDSKAAVRWIRANAGSYNFDSTKVGVLGWSAGGHMAAFLGVTKGDKNFEGVFGNSQYSSEVQAVALLAGPTFVLPVKLATFDPSQYGHLYSYVGGDPTQDPLAATRAAAATTTLYVDGDEPPFLLQYGNQDFIVPFTHGQLLDRALKSKGEYSQLWICNGGHGCGEETTLREQMIIEFFKKSFSSSLSTNLSENQGDCFAFYLGNYYTGKNNTIGLSNGDPRFYCLNSQFYSCGWEGNDLQFTTKVVDGQFVGSFGCVLANSQWVSPTPVASCNAGNWVSTDTTCEVSGQLNRSWQKVGNCQGGIQKPSTEIISCNYSSQIIPCTSFTYSNWSVCDNTNVSTRVVITSFPVNCSGGNPALSQNCTYSSDAPVCTSFTYSNWSSCNSEGIQTRTIVNVSPANCSGGNPSTMQLCTYISPSSQNISSQNNVQTNQTMQTASSENVWSRLSCFLKRIYGRSC